MNPVLAHLKDAWRLSSLPFMLGVFGFGTLLLFNRRTAGWGRRWLMAALLAYWAFSVPFGAIAATKPLTWRHDHQLSTADEAKGAEAVVVLGGGLQSYIAGDIVVEDLSNSALRLAEGVRVYRLLGDPLLIVSGGDTQRLAPQRTEAEAMKTVAIGLGVPSPRIVVEADSLNTRDEAVRVKAILADRGISRLVLVTAPTHMSRSLAIFRKAGLDPIPSASQLRSHQDDSFWTLFPDRKALLLSDSAIYEYAAWIYYVARGWV